MSVLAEPIKGTVVQHAYRTALVKDIFLTLPRELLKELEEQLAELAGQRPDNHTVYELTQPRGTTYIFFNDFSVNFATSIEVRSW